MRLLPVLLLCAATPIEAQVRGPELFQLMGKEILTRTTGTSRLQWLPGGGYLESAPDSAHGGGGRAFYRVDPQSGKRAPLFDEKTAARIGGEYARVSGKEVAAGALPFSIFTWEHDGKAIGFMAGGERYAYDLASGQLRRLRTPAKTGPVDLGTTSPGTWSPDFSSFAFIRDYDNVWLFDPATGKEEQLVQGTSQDNLVAFLGAGPWFVWSPDGRWMAYLKATQSGTPYPIMRSVPQHATVDWFKYPFTTDSTSQMELWVVELASRQHVKLATSTVENPWIRDITWLPGGNEVAWQLMNQWQSRLEVNASDVTTGAMRQLLVDEDSTFLSERHNFRILVDGKRFLWSSEGTGWRHIYLHELATGRQLRQLTSGEWETDEVVAVDDAAGWVYFTAAAELGMDRYLHRVKLDGSGLTRLTPDAGFHSVSMDATARYFTDEYSSLTSPRSVTLRTADGKPVRELATTNVDRVTQLGLEPPELVMVKAADGTTDINGLLFKPADFDPARKYPVIVHIYGGPHSRQNHDTYLSTDYRARIAQLGFLVVEFDGRGTPQRGKKFGAGNYLKLGQVDIDDQAAAMRQLGRRPYVDSTRVGVSGISHGGYNTLMMVLRYPDVFQVGVAQAPLTDLRNGPRQYTGWNMRTPEANPDGYAKGDAVALAGTLRAHLLIQHGTDDHNAVLGNTMQFARKAIDAGRPLDMMIYPEGSHVLTGKDATHGFKGMLAYFLEHLRPEGWERSLAVVWGQ